MLLEQTPRGLLTLHNELSGWFSFGQYKNGGKAHDVARWLQMFDGDSLIIDRKTSGQSIFPVHRSRSPEAPNSVSSSDHSVRSNLTRCHQTY